MRPPFGVTLAAHVCVADPCWDDPLSGEELAWFPRGDALVPLQAWPFADWF